MNRWKYLIPTFNYYMRIYKDKEIDNYYEIPFSDASYGIDKFLEYLEDIGYTVKEIFILGRFIAYKKAGD